MNIEKEARIEKNILLKKARSAVLSTIDNNGIPNASYAPIAIDIEKNIYMFLSELAKHTANLKSNKKVSLMLIEDEGYSTNIFARKRLTINAEVEIINRGTSDWYEKIIYLDDKYGENMKFLKKMSDFHLFQLTPIDALLVFGFGKAFKFYGEGLEKIKHLNESGHKSTNNSKTKRDTQVV